MNLQTFCCQWRQQVRNFRSSRRVDVARGEFARGIFFVLRSLLAPGGSIEIPKRFSSLPLFFAWGRFATFFFQLPRRHHLGVAI